MMWCNKKTSPTCWDKGCDMAEKLEVYDGLIVKFEGAGVG